MGLSKDFSKSKRKALAQWFPTLAELADDARTAGKIETLEILMDVEQVSDIFASFDDVRQGRVMKMNDAFGDL